GRGTLGEGVVEIYRPDGTLVKEFAAGGPLAEPWAVVKAPKGFGAFGGDILVGNVADGHITVYDAKGNLVTQLKDGLGNPIAINGLWGLSFGHGTAANGPTTTLFFNAGIGGYRHGLVGPLVAIEPGELERGGRGGGGAVGGPGGAPGWGWASGGWAGGGRGPLAPRSGSPIRRTAAGAGAVSSEVRDLPGVSSQARAARPPNGCWWRPTCISSRVATTCFIFRGSALNFPVISRCPKSPRRV